MTERAEHTAVDPLEMLLDAARYAEGNGGKDSNPEWAKAARAAVAKARLAAPPAAGWDEAIEAAAQIAVRYCVSPQCVSDIHNLAKSPVVKDYLTTRLEDKQLDAPVRLTVVSWEGRIHCAYINNHRIAGGKPWAGGTTEKEWSTSLREVIRALPDLQNALGFDYLGRSALRHNAPLDSGAGKSEPPKSLFIEGWITDEFAAGRKTPICNAALPDHGGADAGVPATVTYTNYRGETSVRSIVPKSVRYGSTEWHPEPQWLLLACDTEKKADREFALKDFGAKPVPVDASAEARLRDHLGIVLSALRMHEEATGESFDDEGGDIAQIEREYNVLSAHPHASDCDKQGSDCGAARCRDLGCFGACKPSDRTADVTVDELAHWLLHNLSLDAHPLKDARALLDAFTVGRR